MSFSQNGPRAVCILSASGAISNVTLRQSATSGGTATYEVYFLIYVGTCFSISCSISHTSASCKFSKFFPNK